MVLVSTITDEVLVTPNSTTIDFIKGSIIDKNDEPLIKVLKETISSYNGEISKRFYVTTYGAISHPTTNISSVLRSKMVESIKKEYYSMQLADIDLVMFYYNDMRGTLVVTPDVSIDGLTTIVTAAIDDLINMPGSPGRDFYIKTWAIRLKETYFYNFPSLYYNRTNLSSYLINRDSINRQRKEINTVIEGITTCILDKCDNKCMVTDNYSHEIINGYIFQDKLCLVPISSGSDYTLVCFLLDTVDIEDVTRFIMNDRIELVGYNATQVISEDKPLFTCIVSHKINILEVKSATQVMVKIARWIDNYDRGVRTKKK